MIVSDAGSGIRERLRLPYLLILAHSHGDSLVNRSGEWPERGGSVDRRSRKRKKKKKKKR